MLRMSAQRTQKANQIRQRGTGDIWESRHTAAGNTLMNNGHQPLVVKTPQPSGNGGTQFAAHAIAAVTGGTGVGKLPLASSLVDTLAAAHTRGT
jgi:hypothetical protein